MIEHPIIFKDSSTISIKVSLFSHFLILFSSFPPFFSFLFYFSYKDKALGDLCLKLVLKAVDMYFFKEYWVFNL